MEFSTIYPGWYPGRTVHIHAKVHLDSRSVLTTQLYFDDRLVLDLSETGDGYRGAISFDVRRA